MVPTGTGNQGKPGKMGRHFPVREKLGNFTQNAGKIGKKLKRILKKSGKFVSNSENPVNMVPYFKQKMNFKKY